MPADWFEITLPDRRHAVRTSACRAVGVELRFIEGDEEHALRAPVTFWARPMVDDPE